MQHVRFVAVFFACSWIRSINQEKKKKSELKNAIAIKTKTNNKKMIIKEKIKTNNPLRRKQASKRNGVVA